MSWLLSIRNSVGTYPFEVHSFIMQLSYKEWNIFWQDLSIICCKLSSRLLILLIFLPSIFQPSNCVDVVWIKVIEVTLIEVIKFIMQQCWRRHHSVSLNHTVWSLGKKVLWCGHHCCWLWGLILVEILPRLCKEWHWSWSHLLFKIHLLLILKFIIRTKVC